MVHKKYTYRNGRKYGPYLYKSERVGKKVITKYIGSENSKSSEIVGEKLISEGKNNYQFKNYLTILLAVFVVAALAFAVYQGVSPTGRVSLDVESNYNAGELLDGILRFNLRQGELVPANSKVVVSFGDYSKEFLLSDLTDIDFVSGDFFAEGTAVSGNGEGYGLAGKKIVYPEVGFRMEVFDEDAEPVEIDEPSEEPEIVVNESAEVSEETSEVNETTDEIINDTSNEGLGVNETGENKETDTEIIVDNNEAGAETGAEEDTGNGDEIINAQSNEGLEVSGSGSSGSEEESESAESGVEASGITGAVVEGAQIVNGKTTKGTTFVYYLDKFQSAKIIEGSVNVEGQRIEDSAVSLKIAGEGARVDTDYSIEQEGFGQEYLGKGILELNIDVTKFGFIAENDSLLNVKLVYNDNEIVSASDEIKVKGGEEVKKNESEKEKEENESLIDINETIVNETILNETLANETLLNETIANLSGINIITTREKIRVGEKVKWTKNVSLDEPKVVNIELPSSAENISVVKLVEEESLDGGLISGMVSAEINIDNGGLIGAIKRFLSRIGITGRAVDENGNEIPEIPIEVTLEDNATDYLIEYYTPAPEKLTEEIDGKEIVTISADEALNYTDIIASESYAEGMKIYWYNYEFENVNESGSEIDAVVLKMPDEVKDEQVVEEEGDDLDKIKEKRNNEKIKNANDEIINETSDSGEQIENADATAGTEADTGFIGDNKTETSAEVSEVGGSLITGNVVDENGNENGNGDEIINAQIDSGVNGIDESGEQIIEEEKVEINWSERNFTEFELRYGVEGVNYTLQEISFDAVDLDNDTIIDYAEWVVPHLSDQTYQIVINVQNTSVDDNNNLTFEAPGNFSHLTINNGSAPYNSLVGYWNFDVNTTQPASYTAYDLTKNNHDLTSVSARTTENSSYGNAVYFNTSIDAPAKFLTGTPLTTNDFTGGITISVWNKYEGAGMDDEVEVVSQEFSFICPYLPQSVNRYAFILTTSAGIWNVLDYTNIGNATVKNKWTHWACAFNGSNAFIWMNGVLINNTLHTAGSVVMDSTGEYLAIGGRAGSFGDGTSGEVNGSVDEVMIFNASLTTAQILAIYNNQSARFRTAGIESVKQFNITTGDNAFNVSLDKYQRYLGSNISVRIGEWNYSAYDYNTTDIQTFGGTLSNLTSYYNFDNRSSLGENGTHVADRTGNNNNGTVEGGGLTLVEGVYGNAYSFDGIDDHINATIPVDSNKTIALWYRNASSDWIHVVNSSNTAYINGITGGAFVQFPAKVSLAGTTLEIGINGSNAAFLGKIDEVLIFNRTLSANEVKELYIKGRALWNYTAWQNISRIDANDNSSRNQFNISTTTTNILPEFELLSGGQQFYSPVIGAAATPAMANLSATIMVPDEVAPAVAFNSITPSTGAKISTNFTIINVSIVENNLQGVNFSWNGTNYSLFDDDVVLYMNFENLSTLGENGTRVADFSRFSNNGTVTGATATSSGKIGGAYEFDNIGADYINLSNPSSLNLNYNLTISAWIKTNVTPIFSQDIVCKFDGTNLNYCLFVDATRNIEFYTGLVDFGKSNQEVSDGKWHHIVGMWNGSNSLAYVDGILGTTKGTTAPVLTTAPAYIGSRDGANRIFNGSIDEVQIWNKSLTAAQVRQLYYSSLQKYNQSKYYLYVNQSNLTMGNFTYVASAIDRAGNANNTEERVLNVDHHAPNITFVSPTPSLNGAGGATVVLNASINDTDYENQTYAFFNDSLALWMRMDDSNSSGGILDISGNSNNGTAVGAVYTSSGKYGGAYKFNATEAGGGNLIAIQDTPLIGGSKYMTISYWILVNGSTYDNIISKWNHAVDTTFIHRFPPAATDELQTLIAPTLTDGGTVAGTTTDADLIAGNWYYITVVYDGTQATDGTKLKMYVNGVNKTMSFAGTIPSTLTNSDYPVYIGGTPTLANQYLTGTIDEVLIFNRSLSATEILALYNSSQYSLTRSVTGLADGEARYYAKAVDLSGGIKTLLRNFTVDGLNVTALNWSGSCAGGCADQNSYLFGEVLDYVNATVKGIPLSVNLSLIAPDGTVMLRNTSMFNASAVDVMNNWSNTSDVQLRKAGMWNITIYAYSLFETAVLQGFFNISVVNRTLAQGYFGYDTQTIPNNATIAGLGNYGYDLIEIYNLSSGLTAGNWTEIKAAMEKAHDLNMKVGLKFYLDYNLSGDMTYRERFMKNISELFDDLLISPYVDTVDYIKIEVNGTGANPDANITNENLDKIGENITSITGNEFVVYTNYNSTTLDTDYIQHASDLEYVTGEDEAGIINILANLTKVRTSKTRIYYGLDENKKNVSSNYFTDIIVQLTSGINATSNISEPLVSELGNGDLIIYNNDSLRTNVTFNVSNGSDILGKDIWDYTNGILVDNNSNGTITFLDVENYSAILAGTETIQRIDMDSLLTKATAFKTAANTIYSGNRTDGVREGASDASTARAVELWDGSYVSADTLIYYGWLNVSGIASPYRFNGLTYLIIADKNDAEIDKLFWNNVSITGVYGYVSVADYLSTNDTWYAGKKTLVDRWIAYNESINLFFDGLDAAEVSDVDGSFDGKMKNLTDYVKINLVKEVGVNIFTNYQQFAQLSSDNGFAMRESCTHKWIYKNGVDSTAGYNYSNQYWEDFGGYGDYNQSKWYNKHNVNLICVAFAPRNYSVYVPDTMNNSGYELMNKLFLKSKVLGYPHFVLATPHFNIAYDDKFYNVGTKLQSEPSIDGDLYSMRYTNGIAYYNSTADNAWFDDGRTFANGSITLNLFDDVTHTYQIGINGIGGYNVTTVGDGFSYDWYTLYFNESLWNSSFGHYVITASSGDGGYFGDDTNSNAVYDRHSFYNASGYWAAEAEGTGNHMANLMTNDTKSTSLGTTFKITQMIVGNSQNKTVVNLSSAYSFRKPVRTYTATGQGILRAFRIWDGTTYVSASYTDSTACDTANPVFTYQVIAGVGNVGVCVDSSVAGTIKAKVEFPTLSYRAFELDLDNVAPNVLIKTPVNATYGLSHLPLNFTTTLNENGSVVMSLDGGTHNVTMSGNESYLFGTWFNASNASFADGDYILNVYANDTWGTKNYTERVTFGFDATKPNVSFISPSPTSGGSVGAGIVLNVSVNDTTTNKTYGFFNDSLVLWLRMDDNNRTTVFDRSASNANNGTVYGAVYNSSGRFGGAYSFDGNDYINTVDINQIDGTSQMTLSAWIYENALSTNQALIVKWDYMTDGSFGLQTGDTNADEFTIYVASELNDIGNKVVRTTNADVQANKWYHLAVVYNGSEANADRIKYYLNGGQLTTTAGTIPTSLTSATSTVKLGIFGGTLTRYFNGAIDEVLIFNRTLSATEILALYNSSDKTKLQREFDGGAGESFSYTAWGVDMAGNTENTTLIFSVDAVAPAVNITAPENSTNHTINSVNVNATIIDATGLSLCWWSNSSGKYNRTFTCNDANLTTLEWDEGQNNVTVWANDSANNINFSAVTFYVDTIVPALIISNPGSGVTYTSNSQVVTFQYTVSENGTGVSHCNLTAGGSVVNSSLAGSLNSGVAIDSTGATVHSFKNAFASSGTAYTWNIDCYDYAGNVNASVSRTFTVTAPVVTAAASTTTASQGGGGGGAGSVVAKPTISVYPDGLSSFTAVGGSTSKDLMITNLGEKSMWLGVTVSNSLEGKITVEKRVVLNPGEEKVLNIIIQSGEKGLITGEIILNADGFIKRIPIIIDVKTENFLFDTALTISEESKTVNRGDKVRTQINLIQVGPKEKVDVTANYVIKDFNGKVYLEESETFFVLENKEYVKEFDTKKLPSGKYIAGIEIVYPGAFATSSSQFEVVGAGGLRLYNWYILLAVAAIAFVIFLVKIMFWKKKASKRLIVKVRKR